MKSAIEAFEELNKKPNTFINVCVDNWRGWRFIFDTEDVRNCNNDCKKCKLFNLLRDGKEGIFSANLYKANQKDKKLFGRQNFLNCKTLEQYADCYVNFLVRETNTENKIKEELNLIKNFRVIFSKETNDLKKREDEFKKSIFRKVLGLADDNKKIRISRILKDLNFKI